MFPIIKIQNSITREDLLKKYSQEIYMSHYLGITVSKEIFLSPFRIDKNPTCSCYKSESNILYVKDHAYPNIHFDFVGVVMYLENINYHDAIFKIARDFNILNMGNDVKTNNIINKFDNIKLIDIKNQTDISVTIDKFRNKDIKYWEAHGITMKTLEKYNVFRIKNVFKNKIIINYDITELSFGFYYGKKNDVEYWRIYFPERKTYRFLSNWTSRMIQGFNQLDYKNNKYLVITKSLKDVMLLSELGYNAIAPNSETLFIEDEVLNKLKTKFKKIIVLYDNDEPGLTSMIKIKKEHRDLNYTFIPKKYKAKDISDFYKKYGIEKTKDLIKTYLKQLKNEKRKQNLN